jgi:hypothetical protein
MRAKPKKWAAESLVTETESRTPLTPKQQREAGDVTLGMLSVAFGGKLGKEAIKKIFSRIQSKKVSSQKIKEIQNVIKKARKDALDKEKASVAWSDIATDHFDKTARVLKQGEEAYKRVKGKAKGGYVKKYANGGGVRKVRT